MQIDGSTLERPAPPLNELLRAGLEARPDEVALVSTERSLTWRELDAESARLAGSYRGLGLEAGDRLASLMPNRIDLVVHYLACFRAGLIATPLNYRYTAREIDHALEVSGAKALLVHVERVEDVAQSRLAGELELGTIAYGDGAGSEVEGEWSHGFAALLEHEPLPDEPPPDPGEPAAIFFTVMAMLPAALLGLVRDHDLRPGDFACLRIYRAGSDKVSTELLSEFAAAAGFPIVEGYGMTEVGLATLNPPSGEVKQGSIGPPICGYSIALRDEHGDPIEGEAVGRIWIRTRSRMSGYWQAPEATAEVVLDEWLDSGDLARADADGYLWFFGRKKQVIVHDGSNISPLEVEAALGEHPAIDLAGVVGIHDTVHGENVRAYVSLREGAERPSSADLIVFCRERVGYKAPEEIIFLEQMPLNPTGKIDRVGLKRMAEDHLHPHGL